MLFQNSQSSNCRKWHSEWLRVVSIHIWNNSVPLPQAEANSIPSLSDSTFNCSRRPKKNCFVAIGRSKLQFRMPQGLWLERPPTGAENWPQLRWGGMRIDFEDSLWELLLHFSFSPERPGGTRWRSQGPTGQTVEALVDDSAPVKFKKPWHVVQHTVLRYRHWSQTPTSTTFRLLREKHVLTDWPTAVILQVALGQPGHPFLPPAWGLATPLIQTFKQRCRQATQRPHHFAQPSTSFAFAVPILCWKATCFPLPRLVEVWRIFTASLHPADSEDTLSHLVELNVWEILHGSPMKDA